MRPVAPLHSLDHAILAVRDLEAATRSYALLLGRSPSWRGEHGVAGTGNTLFRLDNTYIELLSPVAEGPAARAVTAWLDARGESPLGLAFGTHDATACHACFADRGLEPGPVEKGVGRDRESGAFREWQRVPLPLARTRGVLLFAIEHTSPADLLPPAPALADASGAVSGLDHAVIRSSDGNAGAALYGRGLGLRLALDREFPQWGARLLFFRVGGITVEMAASLGESPGSGSEAKPAPGDGEDQLWGLSYRVPDADAARARLIEAGFTVSDVRPG